MKTFTLTQPAYGKAVGDQVKVDETDPLVQLNIQNGVLTEDAAADQLVQKMTCPICVEQEKARPKKVSTQDELEQHYADKHQGFAVPAWSADNDGKE